MSSTGRLFDAGAAIGHMSPEATSRVRSEISNLTGRSTYLGCAGVLRAGVCLPGLVALVALFAAGPAWADRPGKLPVWENNALEFVQFHLVSGRLQMTWNCDEEELSTSGQYAGRREKLRLSGKGGSEKLTYQLVGPDEELKIEILAERLLITRSPRGKATWPAIEFEQPETGPMTVRIGRGAGAKTYRGGSLWHLLILEPRMCQEYLVPLLDSVQIPARDCDLVKMAEEVGSTLLRTVSVGEDPERRRLAGLVKQLGDARFSRRERADRELREAGRGAVPLLQSVDPKELDAEQTFRIRRILESASDPENDTPEQTARTLAEDPAIWLSLLARPQEQDRRTASRHLESLLGRPIRFDPGADPAARAAQIEAIRAALRAK